MPMSNLFDISLAKLQQARNEVRGQLIEAQLREWPDSLILTHSQMLGRWLDFDKVPFMQTREEWSKDNGFSLSDKDEKYMTWALYDAYVERTRANHVRQVLGAIAIAHQHECVVFYECGLKDGKYQWRGARYGVEGHQYASGFGHY